MPDPLCIVAGDSSSLGRSITFFFVRVWASELPRHIVLILLDSGDIIHPRRRITNRYILSGMYERGIQADE
ncbi:hypothetical protein KCU67_g26, partial [Aureobasidium melanogenum]